jgi:AcrR family transcriptional regulator
MNKEKSRYINPEGFLDGIQISSEIEKELQLWQTMNPDKGNIDKIILDYLQKVSNDLYANNGSKLIPDLILLIMQIIKSPKYNAFSFNADFITDIIELLKSEGRQQKKLRSLDKRKAVLDAAMIVFSRNGFHETHVDEIAELAGVAKGTVYRYFNSKEDILKEIIKANNEILTKDLMTIFNKDGHMLELIKEAIAYYVEFFDSNKDLYRILTHAPWILKDISEHFYKNIISHLNVVRRRVFILTREGVVKPTDFYTVFYGIFGFIDGVIQKWFRRNCEYSLKDELPVIIEVLLYGFVAEGERKDVFI